MQTLQDNGALRAKLNGALSRGPDYPPIRLQDCIGPSQATRRQAVMLAVTGERLPKAKCGINALESAVYAAVGIADGCHAERDKLLCQWLSGAPDCPTCNGTGDVIGEDGYPHSCKPCAGWGFDRNYKPE